MARRNAALATTPANDVAPEAPVSAPRLVAEDPLDAECAAVLAAKRALDAAKDAYDTLAEPLLARMMRGGIDSHEVSGHGRVRTVAASASEGLDVGKARAALEAAGIAAPVKVTHRKESLRAEYNV